MCVGALGVIGAAWLLRMGENTRQATTMSSAINSVSQRKVRLNIGLPSFLYMFLYVPSTNAGRPRWSPPFRTHPRPDNDFEDGQRSAHGVAIIESRDRCRCVVPWVCAPACPVLRDVTGGLRHCRPVYRSLFRERCIDTSRSR
jgi:hypothetical protein